MKNTHSLLVALLVMFFSLASCEDIIDVEPKDSVTEVAIYKEIDQAAAVLIPIYNSTEGWAMRRNEFWGQRINVENASFEAKFNFQDRDLYNLRSDGWTPGNVGLFADKWEYYWSYVQDANSFISKLEGSPAMAQNPDRANILLAEARFLRANLYRKLINYYGGVPIMRKPNALDGNLDFVRDSYEDCVKFIVSEFDAVAAVLPPTRPSTEFGRATKTAALAAKSRTLLYAASDLHDPSLMPQTKNKELYSYPVATKWADAEKAAKDVIDIVGENALIQVADAKAYQNLFLSPNSEIIFARPYAAGIYEVGTGGFNAANSLPDLAQSPNGYGGWALSSPTHNYALAYNFADGTSTGGVTPVNPNANREMRYYANLLYQGAAFRGRPVNYALSLAPGTYPNGLDSPQGGGNVQHSSKTGYNIRKFQDETLTATNGISPNRPYVLFRVAEMYLNYAEALAKQNKDGLALTYLNRVSRRALQPNIVASGPALLEAIKRERRVELAFEGHNFFDERRWLNSGNLGFPIKGLKWTTEANGTVTFSEYTVVTRPWYDKQYYLPIPENDAEKVPTLLQNDFYQ